MYSRLIETHLGNVCIACSERHIKGLWFDGQKYYGGKHLSELSGDSKHHLLDDAEAWLREYFLGHKPSPHDLPLSPEGSSFRQRVWSLLCEIPYGEIVSYGEISKRLTTGNMSAQAVGGAVGHNPISIIIPCHRVIGANGSLCGYAGGIHIKQNLLSHEGINISRFKIPK